MKKKKKILRILEFTRSATRTIPYSSITVYLIIFLHILAQAYKIFITLSKRASIGNPSILESTDSSLSGFIGL